MTINKNNATLDEDIYLFRLDKNIELHFSIVNNRYKFDKSDLNNIIAQTNAAYFQIRLYRSDEIKYTFAIQPTQDGVAVLTITDDLINDPIELGEYDFQISLLDADKTSMISMPIVKQQLHVCEPLVDNQAIMGRAVLGLSSLASGEIKNAFDSEGNYIREIHNDGDILSAQLINKFEEALDTNTKAIKNSKDTDLPHTVSSKVLVTVPASDITLQKAININNVSINKDRRYYIEFLGSKKLCGVMVNKEISNSIVCSIDGYVIQVFNEATDLTIFITNTNTDDTPISTDLVIYEEEVKYLDSKYLETDLVAQNSISMGRTGDIGMASVAIGVGVEASGNGSFAEGGGTKASNDSSHAEGTNTTASGNSSHAEGYGSLASGYGSHAEGSTTTASGVNSHAEGDYTTASGASSHAEGYGSKASSQFQHVQGKYNIEDKNRKYAHIVGNGAGDAKRSNAHTLDWQGNAWYSGKLTQEGTPTEDKDLVTKKYVDDNILLEQLPILRIDETNKRIYVNCNNMGTYKKYFVPNKYANVYGFSFIYTNEDSSETEIALVGGAITRDDFILCARNTDTLFILILGGTDKYTYTKSTKTLEKRLYGYLKIGNTQEYTPTENYHPATKKYVDDNLTTLKEGITTSDAELIDGRTGANGTIYKNIGDAIRTQCGNLNTLLDIEYVPISNNCIDDSKYVGKNFDSIFGHSGNKKFKLAKKFTSNQMKGYIELEDGTTPSTAFQIYLTSSVEDVEGIQLSIGGTLVVSDNFDKFDTISVDCWHTYDKNIKTFFIGNYKDEYDNFRTQPKSKAINNMESKLTSIHPEQCTFFTKVNNLLKNVALQKGYGINPNYGMPDKVTGIERTTTDFMELRDDCKSTYCNINGYIYYYDENKKYLKSISPQNRETAAGIVALPQSDTKIKYIRYTFVTEDDATLATYWITDVGKPYENDKMYLPANIIEGMDKTNKTESWYKEKKICAYGDSVTEQNKWQAYVASYFGCSFYNRGVGGTTVTQVNSSTNHMSADIRIETIPTDSDVILVFGGHNDWSSASINMGDIKTDELSESVSFKAAFALMLKKIQTRCPSAKIITMTPVGGRTEEAAINQDKQFYIRDLCMTDFANAVKEVSAYYGIPCIDINANSGINTLNHTTYIADLIHPNVEGGKLIANEVINGLKRFEPIVF
jgi:lysophospholipase L1-like esterase